MPFERGAVTFTMFDLDQELPENLIDLFAAKKAGTLDQVTDEPQIGWVTGRHLLDTAITEESAFIGGAYYLALRQAVRKIPSSLLNALCRREEQAYIRANNLEYVSGKIKRQIREETIEKHIQKMPPSLSGIPLVFDCHRREMFAGVTGGTKLDLLVENFMQTLDQEPIQLNAETILERCFEKRPVDFPILNFGAQQYTESTFGRDFLLYCWYFSEAVGVLQHPELGELDLLIEGPLVFAGDGEDPGSGEIVLKKGSSPLRSAEAKAALTVGKKLRKAKVNFTRLNQVWSGTFDADCFAFGSFKLPEGEAMNDDELFQDRMENLSLLRQIVLAYFAEYVKAMSPENFDATVKAIKEWIEQRESI